MKAPISRHPTSSKKATVISYIIPLIIAIAAIIVFSVWFLSSSTLFQKRGTSATCQAEAATYCLGGSRWDPACGPAPDCPEPPDIYTPPTPPAQTSSDECILACQSQVQRFASGICREKVDEEEGLTLNRYTATHSFRDYTPEEIAESFDMSQSWPPSADKLQQVHQLRPDYIALFYRNVKVIKNYRDEEMETALANNWLLKDENGDYAKDSYDHILADIGNAGYQKWVANIIKENIEDYGFDGVFADNSLSARATEHFWGATAMPINPRTGKLYTDEEVREALIGLQKEIKNAIGSKKLVCNGIFEGHRFWRRFDGYNEFLTESPLDGFMSEGLWYQFQGNWMTEEMWKESLDFLVYVQDNFLKNNPNRVYVPMTKVQDIGGEPYPLPPGSTKEQIIKYAFASTMLGIKNNQIYYSTIADRYLIDGVALPLHNIDFGSPLGDYDLIDGTSVYYRDFSKTKILVNPSTSSYTVDLNGDYKTLDGNTVSSITMQPHTGEILLKIVETTTEDCQPEEIPIEDGCNSGYTCCCSGELYDINVKKYVAYNWKLFWHGDEYGDYSGCWDMMQMHYEPAVSDNIPKRIKQADSNIEILLYRNTRAVYGRETQELQLFRQNNWILKTNNGEEIVSKDYPSNFMVDKGNPDYQEWFANWMKDYAETYGYDGAFLDNSLFGSSENMWNTMGVNSHCDAQTECLPINPRTGSYWTNDDWIEAEVGLVNKVKEKFGDKVVVLNGPSNGRKFFETSRHDNYEAVMQRSNMDGFIIELWMNDGFGNFYTEDDWKKSVDMICWIEKNLPKADIVIPVGTGWRDLPESVSNDDFAIYSFASLLLGASSNRYYMLQTPGEGELGDYCRPAVQALYDIDLGVPLDDYRIIEGTRVYERDFSKVKVLVNPSTGVHTINLDQNYKTLDGKTVSKVTLDGYSGVILLKILSSPMRAIQWFRTSPFTSTSGFQSIEELREAIPSCNYVYMDVFIDSIDEVATPRTTYESELGPAVQKAKQEGFKIVWRVQPKVGVKLGNRLSFDPPDPDSCFSNYADAVVYWARKAEEYGVDDFVIGTELSKLEKYNDHWRSLIQNVKDVFTGKISYNTNFWYEDADFNAKKNAVWMQDLDYIEVSAYWRMCSDEEAQRGVTVEELVNNWHSYVGWTLQGEDIVKEHLEVFSETHGKPIVIVTGLQSAEDACITPWAWDRTTVDLNEQDNWYEAVFRAFSDEDWIYGFMFDGAWQTYANKRQNPDNAEFTVQGKPAEQTITYWFERLAKPQNMERINPEPWEGWFDNGEPNQWHTTQYSYQSLPDGEPATLHAYDWRGSKELAIIKQPLKIPLKDRQFIMTFTVSVESVNDDTYSDSFLRCTMVPRIDIITGPLFTNADDTKSPDLYTEFDFYRGKYTKTKSGGRFKFTVVGQQEPGSGFRTYTVDLTGQLIEDWGQDIYDRSQLTYIAPTLEMVNAEAKIRIKDVILYEII